MNQYKGCPLTKFERKIRQNRLFDPLTDTGKCPCTHCASSTDLPNCPTGGTDANPVILSATQCVGSPSGCTGGNNLMFWQLSQAVSQGLLSSQQGAVMRLNPAVH